MTLQETSFEVESLIGLETSAIAITESRLIKIVFNCIYVDKGARSCYCSLIVSCLSCNQDNVFALMTYHQGLKQSFRLPFRKMKLNFVFFTCRAVQSRHSALVGSLVFDLWFQCLAVLFDFRSDSMILPFYNQTRYERSCVLCKKPHPIKQEWGQPYQFLIRFSSEEDTTRKKASKLIIRTLILNMHSQQIDRLFSYLKENKCSVFILNYLYHEPEDHVTRTRDILLGFVTLRGPGCSEAS